MAALAYNPAVIDSSIRKFVDTVNAELGARRAGQADRVRAGERGRTGLEHHDGRGPAIRRDLDLRSGLPGGGFRSRDRGARHRDPKRRLAARLVAGIPAQLPASAGIHPSAFVWLNTKGALGMFSALAPSPAVAKLLAERDPVLVVFDGKPEQIHAASRTRLPV